MDKVEIYYYSGTGNSLHVARELGKRIPGTKLIPIISLLDKDVIETGSDVLGFVFPIYLSSIPVLVRQFLRKLDVKSAGYIFAAATRRGFPGPCPAYIPIDRILKKKDKALNSFFMIDMVDNSPTGLKPSFVDSNKDWVNTITKEKIAQMETSVQARLDSIQKIIADREEHRDTDAANSSNIFLNNVVSSLIEYSTEHGNTGINYYADAHCTGCGICEKVCLSKKIRIIDGKPVWQKKVACYHCYACFNYCPVQSILINNSRNSYTEKTGRYFHPGISANDIAAQKPLV